MKGEEGKPFVFGDFFVAAYQRGYRWGRDEVRKLLDDIKAHARAAEKRRELPSDYLLQPIVVLRRADGTWELVDGQQRLTTLFLITKYIATKFADAKVEYTLSYETRNQEPNDSRHFLEHLEVMDDQSKKSNIDFLHIAKAYEAIVEWFGEQGNAGQAAIDVHSALSKWVHVIWYEAPAGTNPNELFARLNRDRIALTDSELIKALVLSQSGAAEGISDRQHEIAAQWDSFERDLRVDDFWAFLTGSTKRRATHIDFLFETMTPASGSGSRPPYWTFGEVQKIINGGDAGAFWRKVVERHGLLIGWYHDRVLYHRIGYLVATGVSIPYLIAESEKRTHSAFAEWLVEQIRHELNLSPSAVSLLRYDNQSDSGKCRDVLLLMNVETVLGSMDPGSRFSFHAFGDQGWSLEHIHPQNAEGLKTEPERRDWLRVHRNKMLAMEWDPTLQAEVAGVVALMGAHLAMAPNKTNDVQFQNIHQRVLTLFSAPEMGQKGGDMHGLRNLALLQRDINSKLNNAVFAVKRERILELDEAGAYILPCTRNVFLKYYTTSAKQQLSLWSPQDQDAYYERLMAKVSKFLLPDKLADEDALISEAELA